MPLVVVAFVGALIAGCSNGQRPDIAEAGLADPCADILTCTPDLRGVCQHTCTPDPGPRLVDCAKAEENYEFSSPSLWTFEPSDGGAEIEGERLARGMYSYTDNSTIIKTFTIFTDATRTRRVAKTWEPRTVEIGRCVNHSGPANHAIHVQGGPFLSWGGGIGIGMKNFPSVRGTLTAMADVFSTDTGAIKDVSGWEGVSFWARRGPDSQAGFRVLVGDKNTDDDIAYLMYRIDPDAQRYCERVRECGCLNHRTCTAVHLEKDGDGQIINPEVPGGCRVDPRHIVDTQTMMFCGTPEVINGAESTSAGGSACNTCTQTKCDERWPAYPDDYPTSDALPAAGAGPYGSDRQFFGKPCSPYTLRSGIFGYWCFDPAQKERPYETTEQCGDHWTRVVNVSSDWQFYTVPFNAMAQQGWAKRSAALDLKSVSVVRFTWDGGWVDFWIDDVRFYRTKTR